MRAVVPVLYGAGSPVFVALMKGRAGTPGLERPADLDTSRRRGSPEKQNRKSAATSASRARCLEACSVLAPADAFYPPLVPDGASGGEARLAPPRPRARHAHERSRPPHPAPRLRDVRNAPFVGRDDAAMTEEYGSIVIIFPIT
jgi:hypothetical protein